MTGRRGPAWRRAVMEQVAADAQYVVASLEADYATVVPFADRLPAAYVNAWDTWHAIQRAQVIRAGW